MLASKSSQWLCSARQPDVRFFRRTISVQCAAQRRQKSTQAPPTKTATRAAQPARETSRSIAPSTPPVKNALSTIRPAPTPASYASGVDGRVMEQAKRLLGDHDELLLYTAPSHKRLVVSSIIGGTTFFTVCATSAQSMLTLPGVSTLLKLPALLGATLGIGISSAIFWTPLRQIQSLRLVRDAEQRIVIQVESKSRFLTGHKKRFNVKLDDIRADRDIRSFAEASIEPCRTVPRAEGFVWTDYVKELEQRSFGERVMASLKEINLTRAATNIWSNLKLDTLRMFSRAGMVYIRIESQNWKLDISNCTLLDRGLPLTDLIKSDPDVRDSVLGVLKRHLTSL